MPDKPSIRLPEDDEHGPNPYDSKTMPKDLPKNAWLTSWTWWATIIVMAIGLVVARKMTGG
jgi:hypothetical protein